MFVLVTVVWGYVLCRRVGERYADSNIVEYDRYGGGSVMVWGGICLDGRTDLVVVDGGALTAVRYRDAVLEPVVRPFAGTLGQDFVLMHDNARPHTARVVQAYLEQEGIDVMEWPTPSTDLNPIEHFWDILQRHVSWRQNPPPHNSPELLREEWNGINQVSVRRLIRSMPRRCRECIQSRGGHTSYWNVFSPLKLLYRTSETTWTILCALCDHFVFGG